MRRCLRLLVAINMRVLPLRHLLLLLLLMAQLVSSFPYIFSLTGTFALHVITIDAEMNFLLTGKKRSRVPSGDTKAAEKKAKKQRAQGGGPLIIRSPDR